MNKKISAIKNDTDCLTLTWIINHFCTNHCSYCNPILHRGKNKQYEWEDIERFFLTLTKKYKKIHCAISGGEPSVSPYFVKSLEFFKEHNISVGITSNGARDISFWGKYSKYLRYICFSYHPSYADPLFEEKVLAASENCDIAVRVMMDTRHWGDTVEKYFHFCKLQLKNKYQWRVEPVKILLTAIDYNNADQINPETVGANYSEAQLRWIQDNSNGIRLLGSRSNGPSNRSHPVFFYKDGSKEEHGNTNYLIANNQNDFRKWECNIGIESLFIAADGQVNRGNCHVGKNIYNIKNKEQFIVPSLPILCTQKVCGCNTDVGISKKPKDNNSFNIYDLEELAFK